MSRAEEKKKSNKRSNALYICNIFDCKKSRDKNQCCDYCVSQATCNVRCQNDSETCGKLYINHEMFSSMPRALRRIEDQRRKG